MGDVVTVSVTTWPLNSAATAPGEYVVLVRSEDNFDILLVNKETLTVTPAGR